jgi:hypothetical protein
MLLRGNTHALYQRLGLIPREPLSIVVVGKLREGFVHEFYAPAVEERAITRDGYQHGPAAVIGYADDAAFVRHDILSPASVSAGMLA